MQFSPSENSVKQLIILLFFSTSFFLNFSMETYGAGKSQGSWGILPFVLTSTSQVSVAKKAERSFLKERFNIEFPLESLKGVIKVVGGCLKLIKEKNL